MLHRPEVLALEVDMYRDPSWRPRGDVPASCHVRWRGGGYALVRLGDWVVIAGDELPLAILAELEWGNDWLWACWLTMHLGVSQDKGTP